MDGIEIDHPSNSPEDKAECAALCGQYHLIHTGGTDFHGANHKKVYPVGTCTTTAPAALAVASTSRTGIYAGEWSTLPRGFQPNSSW